MLIVGGTVFVGRALTDAALARGHAVTQLNRGQSSAIVPAGVEHLRADRDGSLEALNGRSWDAVIDTCAYFPRQVRGLLTALDGMEHYTLISSAAVYADHSQPGLHEASALATRAGDEVTAVEAGTYGPLKVACEQAAHDLAAGKSLLVRPGIIVGPHDPTGRFGYWVDRFARAGEFLAPGDGSASVQVIDVRDLADWIVRMAEQHASGAFNAVGPVRPLTFQQFVTTGLQALQSRTRPVWVPEDSLTGEQTKGQFKLPLWHPRAEGKHAGMFTIDGRKAFGAGLRLRSLGETIADVARGENQGTAKSGVGPTPEEEAAVLARRRPAGR